MADTAEENSPGTSAAIADTRLRRVRGELQKYEHPLLLFEALPKDAGVEVIIRFRDPAVPVHTYCFELHPRDLDHPQFEWHFQRQLYDCLHDYFIEMFTRTPQSLDASTPRSDVSNLPGTAGGKRQAS